MLKTITFFVLLCTSFFATAQNGSITIGQGQDAVTAMYFEGGIAASELFGPRMAHSDGVSVLGTPFLDEDFLEGEIVIRSNDPLQPDQSLNTSLRFNTYSNEFEFINKADTLLVSNPKLIKTISIGDANFMYTLCAPKENLIEPAYMEVLSTGNVKLLKRYDCIIEQNLSVPYYMSGNGDGNYYYKTQVNYYTKRGGENATKLPYNIGKTAKLFGSNSNKAKEKIKSDDLKIRKNEIDLIKLFDCMNAMN